MGKNINKMYCTNCYYRYILVEHMSMLLILDFLV